MKIWKVAVVGCGTIAEYAYLPQMKRISNARIVAVCDSVKERAEAFSKKFNIPEWYTDTKEMIEKCNFDIMMDLAGIQYHHKINMLALNAGKHLYSQKPFASSVEEATEQINTAKKNNIKFSVAPIHMIRPEIVAIKKMIENGVIGDISLMKISFSHGGPEYFMSQTDPTWFYQEGAGALADMGIHGLHQATGLLGPARSVGCMAAISEPVRTVRGGPFDGKKIKADKMPDNYIINLSFSENTLGLIDTGFIQKAWKDPIGGFEIYGTKGVICLGGIVDYESVSKVDVYLDSKKLGIRGWMEPVIDNNEWFQCMCIKDLIEAIEEDKPTGLPAEHGRHVIDILNKIPVSLKEEKIINIDSDF